ncbi:MAG: LPS-assembly protein LptD [Magnetovibrionaceae bacterium]
MDRSPATSRQSEHRSPVRAGKRALRAAMLGVSLGALTLAHPSFASQYPGQYTGQYQGQYQGQYHGQTQTSANLGGPLGGQIAQVPGDLNDKPTLLTADEMEFDQELGVTTARGNVEVTVDDYVLITDTLSYNARTDVMSASGNVSLLEPDGNVMFAEYFEVSGDMRDGIIRNLQLLMTDKSRVAAAGGRRSNGDTLELRKAVYSPCDSCKEDPSKPPLWQIKAIKVVHDKSDQIIEYTDAWLEVAGLPVFYTPYLRHPDPTVGRETGFLPPTWGGSSDLGAVLRTPFYWNIAPDMDATITPMLSTDEYPGVAVEHRRKLSKGELELFGSVTYDENQGVRGHVDSWGKWHLDPTWRTGFELQRASDDTYQRRYGFASEQSLETHGFVEGFRGRNYASADAFWYQSLKSGESDGELPIVTPYLRYEHMGKPDSLGGHNVLSANFLTTTRQEGSDTRRLSATGGWVWPKTFDTGDVVTASASVQGDLYHVTDLDRESAANDFTGVTGRVWPEASLKWQKPFANPQENMTWVVEPIAMAAISPNGGNNDRIPNEDSVSFNFDDTNLFESNRFPGQDRVEGGPRLAYGFRFGAYGNQGEASSLMIGQGYRFREDDRFADGSGVEERLSDIVTRLEIKPGDKFSATWRALLSKKNLEPNRSELNLAAGPRALRVSANYLLVDQLEGSSIGGREEISGNVNAIVDRFWRARGGLVSDLTDGGDLRSVNLGLTYEDECLIFDSVLRRTFYEDRDLKPTDSILFTISLKTLGTVTAGTGSF